MADSNLIMGSDTARALVCDKDRTGQIAYDIEAGTLKVCSGEVWREWRQQQACAKTMAAPPLFPYGFILVFALAALIARLKGKM